MNTKVTKEVLGDVELLKEVMIMFAYKIVQDKYVGDIYDIEVKVSRSK